MGRYSVKRYKTKRRTRDNDLIYDDLKSPESILKLKDQALDETKPGMGQFYCVHCAHYYENEHAIQSHYKSKVHKRRVKELTVKPFTPLESEAASGININKFLASVEKAKERAALEKEQNEELRKLLETNHPKGIMLAEQEAAAAAASGAETKIDEPVLEENEVVMAE